MSSPTSDALISLSSPASEALINNDLVYSEIMTYLSSAEIFRMAKVSSTVRASVGRGIRRVFNFHRHLSPYFPDTAALRSMQARTGAIVAGPVALQFFIRTPIPDVTPAGLPSFFLDLYVAYDARRVLCDWILQQGYQFSPRGPYRHPLTGVLLRESQPTDYLDAIDDMHVYDTSLEYEPVEGVIGMLDFIPATAGSVRGVRVHIAPEFPLHAVMHAYSSKYFFYRNVLPY